MKVNYLLYASVCISLGIYSCKVSEKQSVSEEPDEIATVLADTIIVEEEEIVELKLYKGERTRHFKIIHTKLEVSFDWGKTILARKSHIDT